jgi:hypothetical protein
LDADLETRRRAPIPETPDRTARLRDLYPEHQLENLNELLAKEDKA